MKILVTGANGFLGQHLCLHLAANNFEVIATGRGDSRIPIKENIVYVDVELTDQKAVELLIQQYKPEVIIHSAALSKPDECNNNKEFCIDVNVNATKYLVQNKLARFIYISTDFIFGENGPHAEDEEPAPLNFYGESKWMAENLVKSLFSNYTIVRPVFIYGQTWPGLRPTFLHWVKSNLEKGKSIKVVSDQSRTPTFVEDICKGIHSIIKLNAAGTFHLAGKDIISPYDMALTTAQILGLNTSLIEKVTSETFPEPVVRAKKSGLKIGKAMAELNYNPVSFEQGVRRTFGLQ